MYGYIKQHENNNTNQSKIKRDLCYTHSTTLARTLSTTLTYPHLHSDIGLRTHTQTHRPPHATPPFSRLHFHTNTYINQKLVVLATLLLHLDRVQMCKTTYTFFPLLVLCDCIVCRTVCHFCCVFKN